MNVNQDLSILTSPPVSNFIKKGVDSMEVWRNIDEKEGYQVSNTGNVRSYVNNRHGLCEEPHMLKQQPNKHGYPTVCLGRNNRRLVSRLVAQAFIPNPDNLPLVRHMDDNPKNNHVDNLQWGTQKNNMEDCVNHGRLVGNIYPAIESKKRPVIAISIDRQECIHFNSQADAARELGLWPQHISNVLKGRISQTGG